MGRAAPRLRTLALVALPALVALRLATFPPAVVGIDAVDETVRGWLASVVLFFVCGFGVVRLWLPDALRRHEWLWVLPTGAAALALAMTPLGFAAVPFAVNLAVVLAGFAALGVVAWRRHGWPVMPEGLRSVAWPAYIGLLIAAVAMIPMFRSGFATVVGNGQDAHMAAGSAELLRHIAPLGTDITLPIDTWWPTWRSKQAIYYAFAAVTTATGGLETYETLSALASVLYALAAFGFYLIARELLGASVRAAVVAVAILVLSRMALHTVMHPYFNQTWGLLAFPFCFVLGWVAIRHPSRRAYGMLALFLLLEAFAYPVALPIPLLAIALFWWFDRRERRARGETVFEFTWRAWWRRLRASPRRIRYPAYVVLFLLLVPAWGVFEKITGATQVAISPNQPLDLWGGDVEDYFHERQFFAIAAREGWWVPLVGIAAVTFWHLRRLPRPLAAGLAAVLISGGLLAAEMRFRDFGWYFHFKILAFVAPLVILLAATGLARLGRLGAVALVVWTFWAVLEARDEVTTTFDELPATMLDLRAWTDAVPEEASIRLDVQPDKQPWPAYLLYEHPLCSQRPLHNTAYPHVKVSRAADYVLARGPERPFDAIGPPLRENREFTLWKLRDDLPGEDRCSRAMTQTVTNVQLR